MKTEINDLTLIREFLKGSSSSFDALYERYKRPLYAYLNRLMQGHNAQTDDVFQQTWIRAINKLPTYRDQEKFSAWLMRIAHNLAINYFRTSSRRAEDVLDDTIDEALPDADADPAWHGLDEEALSRAIDQAVKELSPIIREAFLLRRQGIPFQQIAKIQNCPVNTSLARFQYAIQQLRKKLKDWKLDYNEVKP